MFSALSSFARKMAGITAYTRFIEMSKADTAKYIHSDPLQYLKNKGFVVKIRHLRLLRNNESEKYLTKYEFLELGIGEWNKLISKTGGKTEVSLTAPDGKTYTGTSYCSNVDYYSRPEGRNYAIWRTIKQMSDEEVQQYGLNQLYETLRVKLQRI